MMNGAKTGTFKCFVCDSVTFGEPKVRTSKGKPVCKYCVEKGRYKA